MQPHHATRSLNGHKYLLFLYLEMMNLHSYQFERLQLGDFGFVLAANGVMLGHGEYCVSIENIIL